MFFHDSVMLLLLQMEESDSSSHNICIFTVFFKLIKAFLSGKSIICKAVSVNVTEYDKHRGK